MTPVITMPNPIHRVTIFLKYLRGTIKRCLALLVPFMALQAVALSPDPLSDERHLCRSNSVFVARVIKAECVEKHSPAFATQELAHLSKIQFCRSAKYQLEVDETLLGGQIPVGEIRFLTAKPPTQLLVLIPTQEAAEARAVGKRMVFAIDSPGSPFEYRTRDWAVATLAQMCVELNASGRLNPAPVTPVGSQRQKTN